MKRVRLLIVAFLAALLVPTALIACSKTILPAEPDRIEISIDKNSVELDLHESVTLYATASDGSAVVWSSSDENIAAVDSSGVVSSVGAGVAEIYAAVGEQKAKCTVSVVNSFSAPRLELEYTELNIGKEQEFSVNAIVTYKGKPVTEAYTVNWSLADGATEDIVTHTSAGNAITVKGVKYGETAIDASVTLWNVPMCVTLDIAVCNTDITFAVKNATPTKGGWRADIYTLAVDDKSDSVTPQIEVFNKGVKVNDAELAWETRDTSVVSVDPESGNITAVGVGSAVVTGTFGAGTDDFAVVKMYVDVTKPTVELQGVKPLETRREAPSVVLSDAIVGSVQTATVDGKNAYTSYATETHTLALDRDALPKTAAEMTDGDKSVVIETDKAIYVQPVEMYSMIIRDKADLKAMPAAANMGGDPKTWDGYFVLAQDIDFYDWWKNEDFIYWAAASGRDIQNGGFRGIFDGCGHVIKGFKTNTAGGGFIGTLHQTGVIRNVAFTQGECGGYGGYLCSRGAGLIENVYISVTVNGVESSNADLAGIICSQDSWGVVQVKNCFIDIIKESGYLDKVYGIGSFHEGYGSLDGVYSVGASKGVNVLTTKNDGVKNVYGNYKTYNELAAAQVDFAAWANDFWTVANGLPFPKKLIGAVDVNANIDVNDSSLGTVALEKSSYEAGDKITLVLTLNSGNVFSLFIDGVDFSDKVPANGKIDIGVANADRTFSVEAVFVGEGAQLRTVTGNIGYTDTLPHAGDKVTVNCGSKKAEVKADGSFEIELPDGKHKMTFASGYYATIEKDITVSASNTSVGKVMFTSLKAEKAIALDGNNAATDKFKISANVETTAWVLNAPGFSVTVGDKVYRIVSNIAGDGSDVQIRILYNGSTFYYSYRPSVTIDANKKTYATALEYLDGTYNMSFDGRKISFALGNMKVFGNADINQSLSDLFDPAKTKKVGIATYEGVGKFSDIAFSTNANDITSMYDAGTKAFEMKGTTTINSSDWTRAAGFSVTAGDTSFVILPIAHVGGKLQIRIFLGDEWLYKETGINKPATGDVIRLSYANGKYGVQLGNNGVSFGYEDVVKYAGEKEHFKALFENNDKVVGITTTNNCTFTDVSFKTYDNLYLVPDSQSKVGDIEANAGFVITAEFNSNVVIDSAPGFSVTVEGTTLKFCPIRHPSSHKIQVRIQEATSGGAYYFETEFDASDWEAYKPYCLTLAYDGAGNYRFYFDEAKTKFSDFTLDSLTKLNGWFSGDLTTNGFGKVFDASKARTVGVATRGGSCEFINVSLSTDPDYIDRMCFTYDVSVDSDTATIDLHERTQLIATVTKNGQPAAGKWASSKPEVATVDENGLVTAVSAGTTVITVSAGDKSATCTVTVNDNVATPTIELDKTSLTLDKNAIGTATATVKYKGTVPIDGYTVVWAVKEGAATDVVTITENGKTVKFTAVKSGGTTTLVASCTLYGKTVTAELTVTVNKAAVVFDVTNITKENNKYSLKLATSTPTSNYKKEFTPAVTVSVDGTQQDASAITWSVNDSDIATVNASGAITAVKAGKTTVVGTYTVDGDNYTLEIEVNVVNVLKGSFDYATGVPHVGDRVTVSSGSATGTVNGSDYIIELAADGTQEITVSSNYYVAVTKSVEVSSTVTTVEKVTFTTLQANKALALDSNIVATDKFKISANAKTLSWGVDIDKNGLTHAGFSVKIGNDTFKFVSNIPQSGSVQIRILKNNDVTCYYEPTDPKVWIESNIELNSAYTVSLEYYDGIYKMSFGSASITFAINDFGAFGGKNAQTELAELFSKTTSKTLGIATYEYANEFGNVSASVTDTPSLMFIGDSVTNIAPYTSALKENATATSEFKASATIESKGWFYNQGGFMILANGKKYIIVPVFWDGKYLNVRVYTGSNKMASYDPKYSTATAYNSSSTVTMLLAFKDGKYYMHVSGGVTSFALYFGKDDLEYGENVTAVDFADLFDVTSTKQFGIAASENASSVKDAVVGATNISFTSGEGAASDLPDTKTLITQKYEELHSVSANQGFVISATLNSNTVVNEAAGFSISAGGKILKFCPIKHPSSGNIQVRIFENETGGGYYQETGYSSAWEQNKDYYLALAYDGNGKYRLIFKADKTQYTDLTLSSLTKLNSWFDGNTDTNGFGAVFGADTQKTVGLATRGCVGTFTDVSFSTEQADIDAAFGQ